MPTETSSPPATGVSRKTVAAPAWPLAPIGTQHSVPIGASVASMLVQMPNAMNW